MSSRPTQGQCAQKSPDLSRHANDLHQLERHLKAFVTEAANLAELAYSIESNIPFHVIELDKLETLTLSISTLAEIAHGLAFQAWNKAAELGACRTFRSFGAKGREEKNFRTR
jgi:hypothetical protein